MQSFNSVEQDAPGISDVRIFYRLVFCSGKIYYIFSIFTPIVVADCFSFVVESRGRMRQDHSCIIYSK